MRMWKIFGMAGLIGLTAASVKVGSQTVKRQRREIREADPAELRDRLHARLRAAQ